MYAMAIKGNDRQNLSLCFDLISILDSYDGLYCKASADYEGEIGIQSSEGCGQVHRGTVTVHRIHLLCI